MFYKRELAVDKDDQVMLTKWSYWRIAQVLTPQ